MDSELSSKNRERRLDPESTGSQKNYERAKRRARAKRELLDDITSLFEPDFDAYLVTVFGIALDDPASNIPLEKVQILSSGPDDFCFRGAMDPKLFHEKLKKHLQTSGSVYLSPPGSESQSELDMITFHIADSRIAEIELCQSIMEPLGIHSEEAIHEKWGTIDYYSRYRARTSYVLPGESVTVNWDGEQKRILGGSLGTKSVRRVSRFTATDLIKDAFDWSPEESSFDNPSAGMQNDQRSRARRLKALFDAFGLSEMGIRSVSELLEGDKISESWEDRPNELLSILEKSGLLDLEIRPTNILEEAFFQMEPDSTSLEIQSYEIGRIWNHLVDLQRPIHAICEYHSTMSEEGFLGVLGQNTRDISKKMMKDRDRLNKILGLIIDPEQRAFTWGQLEREYDLRFTDLSETTSNW